METFFHKPLFVMGYLSAFGLIGNRHVPLHQVPRESDGFPFSFFSADVVPLGNLIAECRYESILDPCTLLVDGIIQWIGQFSDTLVDILLRAPARYLPVDGVQFVPIVRQVLEKDPLWMVQEEEENGLVQRRKPYLPVAEVRQEYPVTRIDEEPARLRFVLADEFEDRQTGQTMRSQLTDTFPDFPAQDPYFRLEPVVGKHAAHPAVRLLVGFQVEKGMREPAMLYVPVQFIKKRLGILRLEPRDAEMRVVRMDRIGSLDSKSS